MIPTITQEVANIIRNRLSFTVHTQDGSEAIKPQGMDELTCLLICHKMGLTIKSGKPLPPPPPVTVRIKVEGGVATVWECPEGVEVEITDHDGDADEPGEAKAWIVDHTLTERSVE